MSTDSKTDNEKASHPERAAGNFYGRRKAKTLKTVQANAYDTVLPEFLIDITEDAPSNLADLFLHKPKQIVLEIGFGGGEHLIHRAQLHPEIGFIGCEPFINGMAKASQQIDEKSLTNIRLYDEDATELLNWLPDACLARIDLLYPDPWPKKRHWKRRFLNADNVVRFHRVLQNGGEFRFASDIESYVNWGLRHIMDFAQVNGHGFEWKAIKASDWHEPWPEWISTRYEKKAIREGRTPCYMIFEQRSQVLLSDEKHIFE
ncbi:MAG: tRNA (guanosine(46)-N7)-methyltransferase TrmB [Salaquimonas sp.]